MAVSIDILKAELTVDPLARGYSGMSDRAATDDLNTIYRTTNKAMMTGTEVFNAIDKAEFNALSATNKRMVWDILHLGELNPFGLEADLFQDIFGVSTTIISLQALRVNNVGRGVELGIGIVKLGHVQMAREI